MSEPKSLSDAELARLRAYGIAMEIIKEIGVITIIETGETLSFYKEEGIFKNDGLALIRKTIESKVKDENTVGFQKLVIQHIQNNSFVNLADIDQTRYLPLRNKVIDLSDDAVFDYSPDLMLTFKLPITYDESNREMKIIEFLKGRFVKEEERIPDTQMFKHFLECIAAAFVRRNRKRQIHILKGGTDTGKSTTLNLLGIIYGEDNVTHKSLAQLGGQDKYAAADLRNKLANITSELKEQVILNTEILKAITGGDRMDAQKKYGHPFSLRPTCEYFAGLNKLPQLDFGKNPDIENDAAFWGRFDVIPFENHVEVVAQNEKLVEPKDPEEGELSCTKQISGFFNILLPIIKRIYKRGSTHYNPTPSETKQIWLGDIPVMRCLREKCSVVVGGIIPVNGLWSIWEDYRMDKEHFFRPVTQPEFNRAVEKFGGRRVVTKDKRRRSLYVWSGIALKADPLKVKEQATLDPEIAIEDVLSNESNTYSFHDYSLRKKYVQSWQKNPLDLIDILQKPNGHAKDFENFSLLKWFKEPPELNRPYCERHDKTFPTVSAYEDHLKIALHSEAELKSGTDPRGTLGKELGDPE